MSLNKPTTVEVSLSSKKPSTQSLVEVSHWVNFAINSKNEDKASQTGRLLQVNMSVCKVILNKKR